MGKTSFASLMETVYQNIEYLKKKKQSESKTVLTDKQIVDQVDAPSNFITFLKPGTIDERRLSALKHLHNICTFLGSDLHSVFDPHLRDSSPTIIPSSTSDIQFLKYIGSYFVYFILHYPGLEHSERILEGTLDIDSNKKARLHLKQYGIYSGTFDKSGSRGVATLSLVNPTNRETIFVNFLHYQESTTSYIGGLSFLQRISIYPSKQIPLFQLMLISRTSLSNASEDLLRHFLTIKPLDNAYQIALVKRSDREVYSYIKHVMEENNMTINDFSYNGSNIQTNDIDVLLNPFDVEIVTMLGNIKNKAN